MRKPYKYWQNIDNCIIEASKYNTISSFAKNCQQGYHVAIKNNWLDVICKHMDRIGNWYSKCIYSCEFIDNSVYIGLTYNFNERKSAHLNILGKKHSSVVKHIIKTNLIPNIVKLTEYVPVDEAILLEEYYVNKYKLDGWIILNKMKTGGIGGKILNWNYDNCKIEAKKYNTRNEFRLKSSGAYDAAHKNKWLNEICEHMLTYGKCSGYWNKENCQIEALKYDNRSKFARNSSGAYDAAHKNKWLNDICSHMIRKIKPMGYWTFERCKNEALKYNTRSDYQDGSSSAYKVSIKHGWLNEFFPKTKIIK